MVALQILVLTVGVRILLGEDNEAVRKNYYCTRSYFGSYNFCGQPRFFWPLRITASTADSHSVNRSSILLGARDNFKSSASSALFFYLTEGTESNCGASVFGIASSAEQFQNFPPGWRKKRAKTAQREKTGGF